MDSKYEMWLNVYRPVLIQCFGIIKHHFKDIDPNKKRWSSTEYFNRFCEHSYIYSSKYISQYV